MTRKSKPSPKPDRRLQAQRHEALRVRQYAAWIASIETLAKKKGYVMERAAWAGPGRVTIRDAETGELQQNTSVLGDQSVFTYTVAEKWLRRQHQV